MNSTAKTYSARLAENQEEIRAAQSLRYQIFNLELAEGLASSVQTELDLDRFDAVCDHLIVEHVPTSEVVGTYRLQPAPRALRQEGLYSAEEFDLAPLKPLFETSIELGRACVHKSHRNLIVLTLLWKGITLYAQEHSARYLFGCSSLTSQTPSAGASVYAELYRQHLTPAHLRVRPRAGFECPLDELSEESPAVPRLLRAYLALGARVCGPPALDCAFRTIDFLTLLDLEDLPVLFREKLLRPSM